MSDSPYTASHISEIEPVVERAPGEPEWKPVRHRLGIRAFGVNAFVAHASGEQVVEEHTEVGSRAKEHEELYLVVSGHATFTVGGDSVDAPAGTLVFVRDPEALRSAVASSPGTTVLAVGAAPGLAFDVSPWERTYTGE